MFARLTPLLTAAALLCFAAPALADQYEVTTTGNAGGTCSGTSPAFTCTTLQAAVQAANGSAGADEILLQAPGTYDVSQTLTLTDEVTIIGLGARNTQIDGGEDVRVLDIPGTPAHIAVTLFNVTIQNGNAGAGSGGNIRNAGDLTLGFTRVTGGEAGFGGGIANLAGASLGVFYSLIDGNTAVSGNGGGISSTGSVDATDTQVDIADSTIALNLATTGAGIFLNGSGTNVANIDYSTIARNIAGGGIALASGTVEVDISASLLAGNQGGNCPSTTKPIDEQYNLDDANTCAFDDPTSKPNTDPGLSAAPVDAGGGTNVFTFAASSPAVDMVTQCFLSIDQRGYQRITAFGQPCDAGAYEQSAQGPPGPTIDAGPSGPVTGGTATFEFSSDEPGAAFVCRLSNGASPGTFEPCTSPKTYTGLGPGTYVFQVAIADQSGQPASAVAFRQFSVPGAPQLTPTPTPTPTPSAPAATPTPVPQQDATGKVVSGKVLIKQGGKFVPFDPAKPIPDGAEIDVTKGKIELTAVVKKGGKPEKATFYDGIFKLKLGKTTTDLVLSEPLAPCKRGASAAAKKPKSRKLWGSGSGSFRTRGQYSAATVRGTTWLVQDSCAGTLTKVTKGVVSVFDQVKKRTIVLRAGKSYLAKPRR
jgi:hypothetical protein